MRTAFRNFLFILLSAFTLMQSTNAAEPIKVEYMKPPYSTWTALCIDRRYSENTVVEIQMTAYAPKNPAQ